MLISRYATRQMLIYRCSAFCQHWLAVVKRDDLSATFITTFSIPNIQFRSILIELSGIPWQHLCLLICLVAFPQICELPLDLSLLCSKKSPAVLITYFFSKYSFKCYEIVYDKAKFYPHSMPPLPLHLRSFYV